MASGGSDRDAKDALSKILQIGTVSEYQNEFEILINRVTMISQSLLTSFYISGLKLELQRELWRSRPTTLGEVFSLARIAEASEEASPVVKGSLNANEDTLLSFRSEDPNFKIQEKVVEYVRALNAAPLKVVFAEPIDEVGSVIEAVFDIDESNVEGMQVRDKFAEFFEDKGSVEKVLGATKLQKGGNSHSTYSPYHLEDKVNFEGVGNVTPWAAEVGRIKKVKCYVQGSGRRKKKRVIGRDSGRRFVMGWDNHRTYLLSRICV
uniref:Reverse transcriptase n=1 Tax=Tanacetum cinerariifolium TaxID=118510 RepID=A0A6L2KKJ1_TANCI|nr:reverse transcriptase [Tanacetum cinerariifolium]